VTEQRTQEKAGDCTGIQQAFEDYQLGKMGMVEAAASPGWNPTWPGILLAKARALLWAPDQSPQLHVDFRSPPRPL